LFRDLADAKKHGGELHRGSVIVKGVSGYGSPGGTTFTSNPFGPIGGAPVWAVRRNDGRVNAGMYAADRLSGREQGYE
jgi:hypothetical protein